MFDDELMRNIVRDEGSLTSNIDILDNILGDGMMNGLPIFLNEGLELVFGLSKFLCRNDQNLLRIVQ